MSIQVKKIVTLTFAAVGLILIGAVGMCGVNKLAGPSAAVAAEQPAAVAPAPAQPIQPGVPAAAITRAAPAQAVIVSATNPVDSVPQAQPPAEVGVAPSAPNSPANNATPNYVVAEIIDVQPHYITKSVPCRVCHQVPRTVQVPHEGLMNGAGTVIGGVAGGLIGNQFGQGRGRIAATIGGAVLGAVAGTGVERNINQPHYGTVFETVCETRYKKKSVISGYDVTYVYNGVQKTKFMKKAPKGNTLRLSLAPVAD